jgi:beta-lactamase superfamily II metal-dependent hydrolase
MIPSDLQFEGEQRALRDYRGRPEMLRSTVLIAGHHGSRHSNSREFVQAVSPSLVIISCGSGARAPAPEGLAVFQSLRLPIWRTDLGGTLVLTTDGRQVQVRSGRERSVGRTSARRSAGRAA